MDGDSIDNQPMEFITQTGSQFNDQYVNFVEFYLQCSVAVIMLLVIGCRYKQLYSLAQPQPSQSTKRHINRILLVSVLIVVFIIKIILSFITENFWLKRTENSYYSLLWIIPIIQLTAQIYILHLEFFLRVPIMWLHKFYWILQLAISIAALFLIVIIHTLFYTDLMIILCEIVVTLILTIYSLLKKQDILEFEDVPCFSLSLPQVNGFKMSNNNLKESNTNTKDSHKNSIQMQNLQKSFLTNEDKESGMFIRVHVNKNVKITDKNNQQEIIVKLQVEVATEEISDGIKQVAHNVTDFILLEKSITEEFMKSSFYKQFVNQITVNFEQILTNISQISAINSKLEIIQDYMDLLCSKIEFCSEIFLNFLQISKQEQITFLDKRRRHQVYVEQCEEIRRNKESSKPRIHSSNLSDNEVRKQNSQENVVNINNNNNVVKEKSINQQSITRSSSKTISNEEYKQQQPMSPKRSGGNGNPTNQNQHNNINNYYNTGHQEKFRSNSINSQQSSDDKRYTNNRMEMEIDFGENNPILNLYFQVKFLRYKKVEQHYEYDIQLSFVDKLSKKWIVQKRYNQFLDLNDKMSKSLVVKMPPMPKKHLLLGYDNDQKLQERGRELHFYLSTLLNEQIYFCTLLFEFISLDSSTTDKLLMPAPQRITYWQENFHATSTGHYILQENDVKPFAVYRFDIHKININNEQILFKSIEKRYSEFDFLHSAVEIFLVNQNHLEELPKLPSKWLMPGKKKLTSQREKQLEDYLNSLFQVKEVFNSYWFRQFFQLNIVRNEESSKKNTFDSLMEKWDMSRSESHCSKDQQDQFSQTSSHKSSANGINTDL